MARFRFVAVDAANTRHAGVLEAASEADAAARLARDGKLAVEIGAEADRQSPLGRLAALLTTDIRLSADLNRRELVRLADEWAGLLEAGVPLHDALALSATAPRRRSAAALVARLSDAVRGGAAFHAALSAEPSIPPAFAAIVAAGEAAGALAPTMRRLAGELERAAEFEGKLAGALVYPAFLTVAAGAAVVVLLVVVVPNLEALVASEEGVTLPAATAAVIAASAFVRAWGGWIAGSAGLAAVGLVAARFHPRGRATLDRLALRLPLAGSLIAARETGRYARALSAALAGGGRAVAGAAARRSRRRQHGAEGGSRRRPPPRPRRCAAGDGADRHRRLRPGDAPDGAPRRADRPPRRDARCRRRTARQAAQATAGDDHHGDRPVAHRRLRPARRADRLRHAVGDARRQRRGVRMTRARSLSARAAGRLATPTLLPMATAALAWWWRGLTLGSERAGAGKAIVAAIDGKRVVVRAPPGRRGVLRARPASPVAVTIPLVPISAGDGTTLSPAALPATTAAARAAPTTAGDLRRHPDPALAALRRLARTVPVVLVAPPASVLARPLELPAAAARSLVSAVRYGLPQWTPFAADDVHHAARLVARSGGDAGRVAAELRMVPKAAVAPALAALAAAGLAADVVRLGDGFDVALDGHKAARARRGRLADLALVALAIGLAGVLCAMLSERLAARQTALAGALAAEVRTVQAAEALRAEIAALEGRDARLAAQRAAAPPLAEIAATLAAALPEDVEAVSFVWGADGGRLVLAGPLESLDLARQAVEAAAASGAPMRLVGSEPAGDDGAGRVRVEWRLAHPEAAP
jgi:general secretion pathway protein F